MQITDRSEGSGSAHHAAFRVAGGSDFPGISPQQGGDQLPVGAVSIEGVSPSTTQVPQGDARAGGVVRRVRPGASGILPDIRSKGGDRSGDSQDGTDLADNNTASSQPVGERGSVEVASAGKGSGGDTPPPIKQGFQEDDREGRGKEGKLVYPGKVERPGAVEERLTSPLSIPSNFELVRGRGVGGYNRSAFRGKETRTDGSVLSVDATVLGHRDRGKVRVVAKASLSGVGVEVEELRLVLSPDSEREGVRELAELANRGYPAAEAVARYGAESALGMLDILGGKSDTGNDALTPLREEVSRTETPLSLPPNFEYIRGSGGGEANRSVFRGSETRADGRVRSVNVTVLGQRNGGKVRLVIQASVSGVGAEVEKLQLLLSPDSEREGVRKLAELANRGHPAVVARYAAESALDMLDILGGKSDTGNDALTPLREEVSRTEREMEKAMIEAKKVEGSEATSIDSGAETREQPQLDNIMHAKKISFHEMVVALQSDLSDSTFAGIFQPLRRLRTIHVKGEEKEIAVAPLAKVVAQTELKALGLEDAIELQLDSEAELTKNKNPNASFTQEDIQERRAVIGYRWKAPLDLEETDRLGLEVRLERAIRETSYARSALVDDNSSLVNLFAIRFFNKGLENEDVISEGTRGLVKAASQFDWRRGYQFSTLAGRWIEGRIKVALRDHGRAIRLPSQLRDIAYTIFDDVEELRQKGKPITAETIAAHADVPVETVDEVLRYGAQAYAPQSLDKLIEDDGEAVLGSTDFEGRVIDGIVLRENFKKMLPDPRMRKIVMLRFYGEMTQQQIAIEVGLSQMHVSRLLSQALREMREWFQQAEEGLPVEKE